MVEILLVITLATPVLGGLILGVTTTLIRERIARTICIATCTVALLGAGGLLLLDSQDVPLSTWLPGTGQMSLHTGGVGGYAALMVTGTALLTVVVAPPAKGIAYGLLSVALAGANGTLLAAHFLTRYVALETVGLCVALAPIAMLRDREGMQRTGFVYVLLRLGDAGLLIAILILAKASGTLIISEALDAAPGLSTGDLLWTVMGLSVAIWIKCGIWPLQGWLAAAAGLNQITSVWLYGVAMQSLGLYLLYRVTPLMALHPIARWIVLAAALISIIAPLIRCRPHPRTQPSRWITAGSSLLGSAALCCAALGLKTPVTILLLGATPARLAPVLFAPEHLLGSIERETLWDSPSRRMSRFAQSEHDILSLASAVRQRIETDILDLSVARSWSTLMRLAELSHSTIEEQGFGTLIQAPVQILLKVSRWLQRHHTGQLRTHLRWVAVGFVLVIAMMVLRGW